MSCRDSTYLPELNYALYEIYIDNNNYQLQILSNKIGLAIRVYIISQVHTYIYLAQ